MRIPELRLLHENSPVLETQGGQTLKAAPTDHHPKASDLEQLFRGDLPRDQAAGIVRHLLTGCRDCSLETRRIWRLGEWPPSGRTDLADLAARVRHRHRRDEPGLI
jgi:hypothetical protein